MKGMLRENLRHHGRRYVATALAVAISIAFITICLVLTQAMSNQATSGTRADYRGVVAQVNSNQMSPLPYPTNDEWEQYAQKIRSGLPDDTVTVNYKERVEISADNGRRTEQNVFSTPPAGPDKLLEGVAATEPGQMTLDDAVAANLEVKVGDTVHVKSAFVDAETPAKDPITVTISGITKAPKTDEGKMYLSAADFPGLVDPMIEGLQVSNGQDSTPEPEQQQIAEQVRGALGIGSDESEDEPIIVDTGARALSQALTKAQSSSSMMLAFMLVFPLIAVVVAAIVVSTTFQVVLHQRRRELALLRSLGATGKQVKGLIRNESAAIGAVASLAGIILGVLISLVVIVVFGLSDGVGAAFKSISVPQMVFVWVLGTLMTLFIGLKPAREVSQISPMAALSPVNESGAEARKQHRARLVMGVLLMAAGAVVTVLGTRMDVEMMRFGIGFLGLLMILIGAVLAFWVLLPKIAFAIMTPIRGIVPRMARANAARNPSRTGSTGTAILIGTVLIVTMLVGAASLRTTLSKSVDAQAPFDLQVASSKGTIPQDLVNRVTATPGIQASALWKSTTGHVTDADGLTMDGASIDMVPDLSKVTRIDFEAPKSGEAMVGAAGDGLPGFASKTITVCADGGGCKDFQAVQGSDTATIGVSIPEADFNEIAPDAPITGVMLRLADDADPDTVATDIQALGSDLTASGPAATRAQLMKTINMFLMVVVALLGVSVVVALVGVANTLSLSVAERTHENGLLRALGLTKSQMQRMLSLEAIGIALSGALIGIVLGVFFGWAAMKVLPLGENITTILVIPWWQILLAVVVAVVAAILASWLPGRHSANVSPTEAMAQVD